MPTKSEHGTNSRYSSGCRCPECRIGRRNYQRKHREDHRVFISSEELFVERVEEAILSGRLDKALRSRLLMEIKGH